MGAPVPAGVAQRTVKDAILSACPPRPCEECGEPFQPVRIDQRFCPGGGCRQRWHRRTLAAGPHQCPLCGRECGA